MLFISHKTEDKEVAKEVLSRAIQRQYTTNQLFLDSDPGSGIEAGAAWERKIYESLKHTRAMIVLCSSNWLKSQWCFVELGYAKAMAISVFPIVIEKCNVGSTLSATQAIDLTTVTDPVARDAAFDRLWTALEEQHLGPKDNLPWPPPGEKDNCPFPGLMYFDEKHAPVFFGREQERDTVIKQLKGMRSNGVPRLLMIVGGSGSGKTSLLRAGVLPWLRHPTEQRDWLVLPPLRYGETPNDDVTLLARLAEVIANCYPQNHPRRPDWKELRDKFEVDDVEQAARDFFDATVDMCQALRQAGAQLAVASDQTPTTLLLIDQFEELLTATARPSALKFLRFLRTLLSRSNGRLLVIGTLRSDYLDTYEQHAESLKPPFLELYRLPPFPWERVTEVIVKPAERVDVTFSEELIARLTGDAPNSDALPLLAFTLEKLFRQCASDKLIELREYEQLGGMTGAITQAVTRILPEDMTKETEQALRRGFVNHLAQVNEKDEFVRRRAHWDKLPDAAKPLLKKFVDAERLLQRSGNKGEFVEVAHEAIFRCWDQLKRWLQDDLPALRLRRRVEALAEEWKRSCNAANPQGDEGLLLTFGQLAALDEWLQQNGLALPERDTNFVEASREKRKSDEQREIERLHQLADTKSALIQEAEQRTADQRTATWRFKRLAAVLAFVGLISVCVSYWAVSLKGKAERIAESSRLVVLATVAGELAGDDQLPKKRILLAVESAKATRHSDEGWLLSSEQALRDALAEKGFSQLSASGLAERGLAVISADNHWIVTGAMDATAKLWDLRSANIDVSHVGLDAEEDNAVALAISADSHWLVTVGKSQGGVHLWDLKADNKIIRETKRQLGKAFDNFGDVKLALAISADSHWLVTASGDRTAKLWDLRAAKTRVLGGHDGPITSVAMSANSHWLVTVSDDRTARLWNLRETDPTAGMRVLRGHDGPITSVAISADSHWLVTVSDDRTARLWDLSETDPTAGMRVFRGHDGPITSVAISSDNRWLATGSKDLTARLWDLNARDGTGSFRILRGHRKPISALAISADGHWGVTGSEDETARLWDLHEADPAASARVFRGLGGAVEAVAISNDSRWLVTNSERGMARVWPLKFEDVFARARSAVDRNFTGEEWKEYFPGKSYRQTFDAPPFPEDVK